MFDLTDDASGGLLGGKNENGWLGVAWWPNLLSIKDLDDGADQPAETTDKKLDRLATIFDVCELNADGSFGASAAAGSGSTR